MEVMLFSKGAMLD